FAAHAFMAPSDIERIAEPLEIVGADIQHDGQAGRRMQPAARGVKRKLADGNSHAAGALVAEAENAFAIGDDNGFDVIEPRIGQDTFDTLLLRHAQKQASRLAKGLTEFLAAQSDRGRVGDRQHPFELAHQHGVKEHLVAVLKTTQENITREIVVQAVERLHPAIHLLVELGHVWRQQPMELEFIPLAVAERGAFVQQRIVEELIAEQPRLNEGTADKATLFIQHCGLPLRLSLPPILAMSSRLGQSVAEGVIRITHSIGASFRGAAKRRARNPYPPVLWLWIPGSRPSLRFGLAPE